jgi:hypothetical protein
MKRREFLMILGGAVMARALMPCAQQAAFYGVRNQVTCLSNSRPTSS